MKRSQSFHTSGGSYANKSSMDLQFIHSTSDLLNILEHTYYVSIDKSNKDLFKSHGISEHKFANL